MMKKAEGIKTGDLISREALKKALNNMFDLVDILLFDDVITTIDNAPTVEITDYDTK